MTRVYRSRLREEQAAATRERILDAAHKLLGTTRPVDLAYADIAAESGVAVRTLYRHFPTPDDLFLALSDRLLGAIMGEGQTGPTDVTSGMRALRTQFAMLEADPALYRVFFAVPTRSRSGGSEGLEEILGDQLAGLSPAGRRAVCGLIDLMGSPYAWDVLHANWGADAGQAYRAVSAGFRAVMELVARSPEVFDLDEPLSEEP